MTSYWDDWGCFLSRIDRIRYGNKEVKVDMEKFTEAFKELLESLKGYKQIGLLEAHLKRNKCYEGLLGKLSVNDLSGNFIAEWEFILSKLRDGTKFDANILFTALCELMSSFHDFEHENGGHTIDHHLRKNKKLESILKELRAEAGMRY